MLHFVEIDISTWTHNNHGLFDYESKELKTSKLQVKTTKQLILHQEAVFQSDDLSIENRIGSINFEGDSICKFFNYEDYNSNPNFQDAYVKLDSNQKQQLHVGELFKLGRMEYFVSEIKNGEQAKIAKDHFNLDRHVPNEKTKQPRQCKFCLMDDSDQTEEPNNPILSKLCNCQGHMSYVHYVCLKEWINFNNRITVKETESTVQYQWNKALECDVCKEPLPARVYLGNKQEPLQMISVVKPDCPYIILEQITRQENLAKSLTLVHAFGNQMVHVGRGHNSEIRCQDISVSRNHANIFYDQEDWYIQDQGSKFGTLRIIQDKLKLTKEPQEIQIGRVLLKIKII